jgi:hypothetical protein
VVRAEVRVAEEPQGQPDRGGGQGQLDERRLGDGQALVQAGRRGADVEPGVEDQQRPAG